MISDLSLIKNEFHQGAFINKYALFQLNSINYIFTTARIILE